MSFSSSINNIARICGYNQAVRHFEETRKPKTARWGDDERPLYNTRSLHYKLVRGANADYFDLVNYDTALIRYYRPDANGDQRILVRDWDSNISRQFLYKHRWWGGKTLTVRDGFGVEREGKLLLNRMVGSAVEHGVPAKWSADLMLVAGTEDNPTIDLTRSRHIPGYKAVASDEDKANRKKLKAVASHWVDLMAYRIGEYDSTEIQAAHWHRNSAGEPFTSALNLMSWTDKDVLRNALKMAVEQDYTEAMQEEAFVEAFVILGHAVWTHLKGKAEYKSRRRYEYSTRSYVQDEYVEPIRADFNKSMVSHLMSLLDMGKGNGRKDIGQFPASIPRKWWC